MENHPPTPPFPVVQVKEACLYVADLDRTRRFYEGLLGFPCVGLSAGRHVFFRAGQTMLLCFIAETTGNDTTLPRHFATGRQHLAFEVRKSDYESVKKALIEKGIPIEYEHRWPSGLFSFYFRDLDGHSLEMVPEGLWD